jgi:hypothetical protein
MFKRVTGLRAWVLGVGGFLGTLGAVVTTTGIVVQALPTGLERYLLIITLAGFAGALWAIGTTSEPTGVDAVLYRDNIKHRNTIEKQQRDISALTAQLSSLAAAQQETQPRKIDPFAAMCAVTALMAAVGNEIRKHRTYAVPTVHDSDVLAAQIRKWLEAVGLHPSVANYGPDRRDYPRQEMGLWIIGDETRDLEQALAAMLRDCGLVTNVESVMTGDGYSVYNGFEILIVVGDDGSALNGTRYNTTTRGR